MLPAVMLFASCDDKKSDDKKSDDKKKDTGTSENDAPETFRLSVCDCVAIGEEINAKYSSGAEDFEEFEKSKAGDLMECEKIKNAKGLDVFGQEAIACMMKMQEEADETTEE